MEADFFSNRQAKKEQGQGDQRYPQEGQEGEVNGTHHFIISASKSLSGSAIISRVFFNRESFSYADVQINHLLSGFKAFRARYIIFSFIRIV